jgi:hypothetical protein
VSFGGEGAYLVLRRLYNGSLPECALERKQRFLERFTRYAREKGQRHPRQRVAA